METEFRMFDDFLLAEVRTSPRENVSAALKVTHEITAIRCTTKIYPTHSEINDHNLLKYENLYLTLGNIVKQHPKAC